MIPRYRFHRPERAGHREHPAPATTPSSTPEPAEPMVPDDSSADDWEVAPPWAARAGRRTLRDKLGAGWRGLKHAVRGDSSFFAHAYRGLLIALTAALLGVGPMGWCLLAIAASLVLIAELAHSAVDTLARALGDPEEPGLTVAREIATAGVLVAVTASAGISITVLTIQFGEMFGWWR